MAEPSRISKMLLTAKPDQRLVLFEVLESNSLANVAQRALSTGSVQPDLTGSLYFDCLVKAI